MPAFKNLLVWQKADDLTVEVYEKTKTFPREERYGLTSQIQRAAVSVGANIAEGAGRGSLADYIRFLFIARGSLSELEYLLHLAYRLGYLSNPDSTRLQAKRAEVGKLLHRFIGSKQKQQEFR